jgi:hypothetical protein
VLSQKGLYWKAVSTGFASLLQEGNTQELICSCKQSPEVKRRQLLGRPHKLISALASSYIPAPLCTASVLKICYYFHLPCSKKEEEEDLMVHCPKSPTQDLCIHSFGRDYSYGHTSFKTG